MGQQGHDPLRRALAESRNAVTIWIAGHIGVASVLQTARVNSGRQSSPVHVDGAALSLIQEGLWRVVRMPTGAAHALDSRGFPIAVMGKTGTTNEFRDTLFASSTYGPGGITVEEASGRVALPVFREVVLSAYGEELVGPAPRFPAEMEQHIGVAGSGSQRSPSAIRTRPNIAQRYCGLGRSIEPGCCKIRGMDRGSIEP
jgi:membrane carboxypeptidase/penicillin-binding protein